MGFPLYIAKRYLFSKSSNNAINIITIIAAAGVVIGAMSLLIVLSGFSGLKEFSLQFTNEFDSDLKISPASGKTLDFNVDAHNSLSSVSGIVSFSKIIEERIFLQYMGKNHIAYIKGVDSNYKQVKEVDSLLIFGEWLMPKQDEVVIGLGTASKLSLNIRDYRNLLEMYVPKPGTGQINTLDPSSAFNKANVVVSGVYEINEELNSKFVFTELSLARSLLNMDSTTVSAVEIKLEPDVSEEEIKNELKAIFSEDILIKNRIQQNDALYKMLNTENIAVYLIFTLVLIIALFNVIGSIIMMILDKRKNIKTLYNLGATIKDVRRIFFLQGALMTTLGGLLGIVLGIIIILLQLKFELVNITASLAYPVKLEVINVLIVFFTIAILGIIASKIAAGRVREKFVSYTN